MRRPISTETGPNSPLTRSALGRTTRVLKVLPRSSAGTDTASADIGTERRASQPKAPLVIPKHWPISAICSAATGWTS